MRQSRARAAFALHYVSTARPMARRLHGALGGLSRPRSLNLPRPWPRRTLSALAASAWHSTTPLPSDPILGLVAAFKEDTAAQKVNLAQGAYRTDTGTPFVLDSVKEAERRVAADLRDGRSDKDGGAVLVRAAVEAAAQTAERHVQENTGLIAAGCDGEKRQTRLHLRAFA